LRSLDKTYVDLEARIEAIREFIAMLMKIEYSLTLPSLENILLPMAQERKKHVIPILFPVKKRSSN
jgi:hypothetical protein